jgi:hypothetical protein
VSRCPCGFSLDDAREEVRKLHTRNEEADARDGETIRQAIHDGWIRLDDEGNAVVRRPDAIACNDVRHLSAATHIAVERARA